MLPESLRNPVQAIALQANIALRIASKSLDLEDHLVQIERACRDLSRLLQGLLEAAELDAGRMPVASQPLHVTGFLNEMLAQHVPFITQVNAVQHSGSPEVRVEATADADVVSTRVIDYGCGIPVATRGESSRSSTGSIRI